MEVNMYGNMLRSFCRLLIYFDRVSKSSVVKTMTFLKAFAPWCYTYKFRGILQGVSTVLIPIR